MTPINHLIMSHHPPADAHQSCTLMLPVSKHPVSKHPRMSYVIIQLIIIQIDVHLWYNILFDLVIIYLKCRITCVYCVNIYTCTYRRQIMMCNEMVNMPSPSAIAAAATVAAAVETAVAIAAVASAAAKQQQQ